jgi:hypothetical protein
LPNLDDLRWKDLVADGRSLIPSVAAEWTNHNPSDPGITLIELFAYVSGTLMYQLNRITDRDTAAFLSLLNGSEWKRSKGLNEEDSLNYLEFRESLRNSVSAEEKRKTVRTLRTPARVVTPEDFELLACTIRGTERAKCLPRLNLENADPGSRWLDAPGHVSVVILASKDAAAQEVLANTRQALEPARLLTTRVHVVAPRFVSVGVRLNIVPTRSAHGDEALRNAVVERISQFLDARRGWFDGKGWPLGRDLYISELYQLIGEMKEVDSVMPVTDRQGVSQNEVTVDASLSDRFVRNQSGGIQAVTLLPDELFEPRISAQDIQIARRV